MAQISIANWPRTAYGYPGNWIPYGAVMAQGLQAGLHAEGLGAITGVGHGLKGLGDGYYDDQGYWVDLMSSPPVVATPTAVNPGYVMDETGQLVPTASINASIDSHLPGGANYNPGTITQSPAVGTTPTSPGSTGVPGGLPGTNDTGVLGLNSAQLTQLLAGGINLAGRVLTPANLQVGANGQVQVRNGTDLISAGALNQLTASQQAAVMAQVQRNQAGAGGGGNGQGITANLGLSQNQLLLAGAAVVGVVLLSKGR